MAQRYDTYKDSGVQWLGEIPGHWVCVLVHRLFDIKAGGDAKPEIYSDRKDEEHPYPVFTNTKSKDDVYAYTSMPTCPANSITVTGRGEVGHAIFRNVPYDAIIRLLSLIPKNEKVSPQYYAYFIDTVIPFTSDSAAIGQLSAVQIKLKNVCYPPLPEQHAIVSYLDDKCGKIDEWVAQKQKEVQHLGELKQRVIADAVSRGLNPNVKMKQANISWLPEVPEHWNILKFRGLFALKKNIAGQLGYDVISVTQQGLKIKDVDSNKGQIASDYSKYQIVEPGDFAMNHMDLLTGYIGLSEYCGVTSPDYRVFRRKSATTCNEYFLKIFELCYKLKIFYGLGQGVANVGRWRLPAKNLLNFELPVPPIDEQNTIVAHIVTKTSKIDKLIANINKEIEGIKEYKQRLISDVVTGKIKVC